ncbi:MULTISPECIES: hypothetical protein [Alphaproteobacteria]|uniref:hypothetical protein n=1 Tax=Alphaproteobacteria TaxID=28211 RepID=UPI00260C6266|nr:MULTISPECIES: hypothetical protein [Alphaproteobacteria]
MNTFWLDFLKTPMAAPETAGLRTLRMAVLSIAVALALSILLLKPMRAQIGAGAGGAIAGLLLALAVLIPVYVFRKNRADGAYLDHLVRERGELDAGGDADAPEAAL